MSRFSEDVYYVRSNVARQDRYLQLAEEAAELSAATAKLVRVMKGTNPAGLTPSEANRVVFEEAADVLACLYAIGLIDPVFQENIIYHLEVGKTLESKMHRWVSRLKERDRRA